MLDWFPNADHAGIYQALAEGDFAKAGFDVHVQVPSDPATPLRLLAAGKVDAAISYEPELLLARNQDLPLVSVAALVQRPLTSIVSVGAKHITKPTDLKGKRVGDAGIPYQHAYLTTILARAGVPQKSVKEINVGDNLVPAMISGRVDATLGAFWNYEAIQLAQLHKHPNVIHMEQVGVPTYDELVLVVRKNTIVSHPDVVRRFVQALGRGYEAVRRNPQQAVAEPGPRQLRTRPEAPAGQRQGHPSSLLPERLSDPPVGLAGPQAVGHLRSVDAEPPAADDPQRRPRRLDQRASGRAGPALIRWSSC